MRSREKAGKKSRSTALESRMTIDLDRKGKGVTMGARHTTSRSSQALRMSRGKDF